MTAGETNEVYELLRGAIAGQRRVCALYKGRYRELCPQALGWRDEDLRVLCIQCGGESSKGLSENAEDNWRCMSIAELSEVEFVEGEWVSARNHSVRNNCLDRVDIEVAFG